MKTPSVYLCSTLKFEWNRAFNPRLTQALEARGLSVYLPQRDTNQGGGAETIFKENFAAMRNATILLAVAKNASPNWGAEVGYCAGLGKIVVVLAEIAQDIPLMTTGMATESIFSESLNDIEAYADALAGTLRRLMVAGFAN
jgi:nucleoside 2-deoxyribosyltransferase